MSSLGQAEKKISQKPGMASPSAGKKMQIDDTNEKPESRADLIVDMSQISGPDGKSMSTPLSQIGFRDPASVGAGQQLTLLSIEVSIMAYVCLTIFKITSYPMSIYSFFITQF